MSAEPETAITVTIRFVPGKRFGWVLRIEDTATGAMRLEGGFKTVGEACEALIDWTNGVIIL